MAYISEYTTDVVHTPGMSNVVADLLSRPPLPPKTPPIPSGKIQVQGEPSKASTQFSMTEMPSSSGTLQDFATAMANPTAITPVNNQLMALCQILCQ